GEPYPLYAAARPELLLASILARTPASPHQCGNPLSPPLRSPLRIVADTPKQDHPETTCCARLMSLRRRRQSASSSLPAGKSMRHSSGPPLPYRGNRLLRETPASRAERFRTPRRGCGLPLLLLRAPRLLAAIAR